jgi:hypothetical protein
MSDDNAPRTWREWVMSEAGPRTRVVDDHMFEIRYPNSGQSRGTCRLQLFEAAGLRPVAFTTWTARGGGCSLTNCAETYSAEVWQRHFPQDAEPPIMIQRQILRWDPDEQVQLERDIHQTVVTFRVTGRFKLSSPSWCLITDDELTELVGTQVDLSRGEGYRPAPEPVSMVRYQTRWVVTLPRPRQLRELGCMPKAGSGLVHRLGRQLFPRRPSACCWYHRGDWDQVSRTAIQLHREAQANNVPDDEFAAFVRTRAEADGITGWDLAALDSLVGQYDGISLDDYGRGYVNGQHRVQAMVDAGVPRTLVVKTWEEMPK